MRLSLVAVLICATLAAVGCGPSLEVERYQIPKPLPPVRMLGAMVPVQGGAWFFKLEGPSRLVGDHVDDFWKFVESVRFRKETREPVMDLPEGWTLAPPERGQMRYATVKLNTKLPLEIAVSSFDQMNMSDDEFRLANINRWRRLLSAEEVELDGLDEVVTRRKLGELEALCVDLMGEKSSRRGMPPMASTPPPPPAGDDPTFEAPEGWEKRPLKMFSIVTFGLPDPDADAAENEPPVVTISQVGGGLAVNATRWYGQVNLPPPASPDELASQMSPIEEAQGSAKLLVLSADEQPKTKTLAIAVMNDDGRDWYVKFTGPRRVWEQQQKAFMALVKSIDFTGESQ